MFWNFPRWKIRFMEIWYLLITENFLFWTFQRWIIQCFSEPKSWWKDDIYWLLKSSCFQLFSDGKYGLFSAKKLMKWWCLLGLFELSLIFQDLGNMVSLHGKPCFFPSILKRCSFQNNLAGIWSFLYYQEWWYFFFPKISSYSLDGKWKMILLKKIYENMIFFSNILKRWSFQENNTGIWSFLLYYLERW